MAGKGAVFIELLGDSSGLVSATTKAQASLAGLEAKTSSAGLASTGFGKVSTVAFLAAGAAVVGFAVASIHAFEEHQKALLNLQSVIKVTPSLEGASTKAFVDQAMALQNLTGANHDLTLAADATLGRVGLTQKQILSLTQSLVGASIVMKTDVPTAAAAISRALLGNARGMKSLGIQFKATGDITKDYTTILADLKARGLDRLAVAFGQSLPGKIAIFQGALHNLEEKAGGALLPVISGMVSGLTSLVKVLGPVGSQLPLVLAGFAGFAAMRYVPVLLTSIALKLAALPVVGMDAFGTLALGLQGVAGWAAPATAGLALLAGEFLLARSANQQFQAQMKLASADIIQFGSDSHKGSLAARTLGRDMLGASRSGLGLHATENQLRASVAKLNAEHNRLSSSVSRADQATFALTQKQNQERAAADQTTLALLAESSAITGVSGAFLSVSGAALGVTQASLAYDQAVQQLNKDIKANTDHNKKNNVSALQLRQDQLAVKQALLGRVTAQQGLTASEQAFIKAEATAHATVPGVIKDVKSYAASAHLSASQTQELIDKTLHFIATAKDVPPSVRAKFSAPGLESTQGTLDSVLAGLQNMTRHQWIVNVQYHSRGMTPTIGNNAAGTDFWRGGLTRINEKGPEIVDLPRGTRIYPAGQSRQMMSSGGGGGDVHFSFTFTGPVFAQSKQQFAEELRTEFIKIMRRNGGLGRLGFG